MEQTVTNYATADIFGSYIIRTREIPGFRMEGRRPENREEELFEMVDDYIEQA